MAEHKSHKRNRIMYLRMVGEVGMCFCCCRKRTKLQKEVALFYIEAKKKKKKKGVDLGGRRRST